MNKFFEENKETIIDVVKDVLSWIVVTALSFVYWLAVLLLLSLFLVNVWIVTFEKLLRYAIVLMVITSIVYLGRIVYRRVK